MVRAHVKSWLTRRGSVAALVVLGAVAPVAAEPPAAVFADDFETPAAREAWVPYAGGVRGESLLWSTNVSHSPRTSLCVRPVPDKRAGGWESPPFPVKTGQYYRVSLFSRATDSFFVAAQFSDERGAATEGDCNWRCDASAEWAERSFCFKPKFAALTGSLVFYPAGSAALAVDDVRVDAVSRADALAWADAIYQTIPPLTNAVRPAGGVVPRAALDRLRGGQPVRIALLGDSIANDVDNAVLDLLLERAFPGARVETVFVGRGGTGWAKYRHQIRERLLPEQPHLVILLAISNDDRHLADDLGEVLRNIHRESPGTDMLLVTPHLSSWFVDKSVGLRQQAIIKQVAAATQTACLDLLQVWRDYLAENGQSPAWLLRDELHMNERGRQLTARAIVSYLQTAAEADKPAQP